MGKGPEVRASKAYWGRANVKVLCVLPPMAGRCLVPLSWTESGSSQRRPKDRTSPSPSKASEYYGGLRRGGNGAGNLFIRNQEWWPCEDVGPTGQDEVGEGGSARRPQNLRKHLSAWSEPGAWICTTKSVTWGRISIFEAIYRFNICYIIFYWLNLCDEFVVHVFASRELRDNSVYFIFLARFGGDLCRLNCKNLF